MPPQTRSKLQIQTIYPMGTPAINGGDSYEESPSAFHGKENEDWDFRFGTPIRPPQPKRKCVSIAVQTSPIEEVFPHSPPALCHDSSSASTSPDPESDGDGSYSFKAGLKRKKSITSISSSQASKKAKPTSPVKLAASQKQQPRRESVISLDGNAAKPRSIYAPSPTPLQCSYVYPVALGPPRRPVDLRRAKGARIMPEVQVPPAAAPGENGEAPAPMDVDTAHKITHRCPITFSREFEMRRHIRTVHIAEEIRAVVEGRLPRAEATVIPDNWDGKTLLSKPTSKNERRDFIRKLPRLEEKDVAPDDTCAICQETLLAVIAAEEMASVMESPGLAEEDMGVVKLPGCGHHFCRKEPEHDPTEPFSLDEAREFVRLLQLRTAGLHADADAAHHNPFSEGSIPQPGVHETTEEPDLDELRQMQDEIMRTVFGSEQRIQRDEPRESFGMYS
ncbi:hypothetical protein FRC06_005721 [Ceratobasidium sp. 370]|nr:hypothetical protein FRC06_005721 [Ceratobasidium sp. 370]